MPEEVYTMNDPVLNETLDDAITLNDMLCRMYIPSNYESYSRIVTSCRDEVETEESNEDALDIFIGTGFNNIVRYARDHKYEFEEFKDEYERLRALWTSYCIINNFTCEHRKYIPSLKHIYLIIGQNNNMSYDDFVVYMGALFNWRLR